MITDDKVRDEKLQSDIKTEAPKILSSSLRKIDNYEYLIGIEILLRNQSRTIVRSLA